MFQPAWPLSRLQCRYQLYRLAFLFICVSDYLVTHDVTNTRNWSPINSSVWSLVITRRLLPVSPLIGHPGLGQASDWLVVSPLPVSCPQPRLPITRRHNAHMSRHPGHSPHIWQCNIVTCSTHYSQLTWLLSLIAAMNLTRHVSLVTLLVVKCYFCPPITNNAETMAPGNAAIHPDKRITLHQGTTHPHSQNTKGK